MNEPGSPDDFDENDGPPSFAAMAEGLQQLIGLIGGGLGSVGGPDWNGARQAAAALAGGGDSEPNVDPLVRMQFEQLARVAELQISQATGLTLSRGGTGMTVTAVTRAQYATATVDAYRPVFEQLATSLTRMMDGQIADISQDDIDAMGDMIPGAIPGLDLGAMMSAMRQFMGPMMLVAMAGSTVGQLASRVFGSYDLPVPRPPSDDIMVIADAIDQFGESWSIPADDLRLYVCLNEMAHHAVLTLPHVRQRLEELLGGHAESFEADPDNLEAAFGPIDIDDPTAVGSFQEQLANPDVMLSAMRSDRQRELLPLIATLVGCIEGYADWVLDTVGERLLSDYPRVSEAFRRRRVETSEASRFVEKLFGLELTQPTIDRGEAFISGVAQRAGTEALAVLWSDVEHLPTPSELEAPGLWLARVGLGDDQPLPELDDSLDIPDFPDLDT